MTEIALLQTLLQALGLGMLLWIAFKAGKLEQAILNMQENDLPHIWDELKVIREKIWGLTKHEHE